MTWSEPPPRAAHPPDRGDPLLELPEIPEGDPEELVQRDPKAPAGGLPCGRRDCDHIVGGPAAGLAPLATGYCTNCGTRYSLESQLDTGDTLDNGRYTVRGPVAHGGLGWVYLAVDHRLNNQYCALKGVLNSHDREARDAMLEERNQLVRLQHPSIVRIYNYVRHPPEGEPPVDYIAMDFVGGKTLGAIMRETRDGRAPLGAKVPLLLEHVARYGCQILSALQTLHGAGLVYCDLKPDNVIHSGRRVVLVDLGGVQREHEDRPGGTVFTPEYAPDETKSGRPPTVRHDIYALGATLRDLAAHAAPPGGRSDEGLAESFTRLVDRACHPTPAARFATAAEMAEQLEGVLRELISLSHGRPVTKPSAVFASSHVLLDAGLGAAPGTGYWRRRPVRAYRPGGRFRAPTLADGRPTPGEVAVGLPVPYPDPDDPAIVPLRLPPPATALGVIRQLRALDAETPRPAAAPEGRTARGRSVEVQLALCRAHLRRRHERPPDPQDADRQTWREAELAAARAALRAAEEELAARLGEELDPGLVDWRIPWHYGLMALAAAEVGGSGPAAAEIGEAEVGEAERCFTAVYAALPGEYAAKLALGYCAEWRGGRAAALRLYRAVWQRNPQQASAAFGMARVYLAEGRRDEAAQVLSEVSPHSRHYDAARVAALRVRAARLPAGPEAGGGEAALPDARSLAEVPERLAALCHDGALSSAERISLEAELRCRALDWAGGRGGWPVSADDDAKDDGGARDLKRPPFGDDGTPPTEESLRVLLAESFEALARAPETAPADREFLVDCASAALPRSWFVRRRARRAR